MILKLNNEEEQVLKFMFKDERINDLPPAIKDVALGIKRVVDNSDGFKKNQRIRCLYFKSCF